MNRDGAELRLGGTKGTQLLHKGAGQRKKGQRKKGPHAQAEQSVQAEGRGRKTSMEARRND